MSAQTEALALMGADLAEAQAEIKRLKKAIAKKSALALALLSAVLLRERLRSGALCADDASSTEIRLAEIVAHNTPEPWSECDPDEYGIGDDLYGLALELRWIAEEDPMFDFEYGNYGYDISDALSALIQCYGDSLRRKNGGAE